MSFGPLLVNLRMAMLLVLMVSMPWHLAAADSPAINLVAENDPLAVNQQAWWLADPEGSLTLADVRKQRDRFQRNTHPILNPGTIDAIIWVRLDLVNSGTDSGTWVLSLDRALLETAEIWFVGQDGIRHLLENNRQSFASSYQDFGTLGAQFDLAPGAEGEIYVRYRGANFSGLQMRLYSEAAYARARMLDTALTFAVFGGVLTLVVYSAITFVFLGAWTVMLYVVAQLSLFALFSHIKGYTTVYLWPESPEFGRVFAPLTMVIYVVASLLFARLFFETRTRAPRLDRVLLGGAVLGGIAALLTPLDFLMPEFDRRIPLLLVYLVTILAWLTLPVLAGVATWRWNRGYWPLLVAWTLMASYIVWLMLFFLGVLLELPLGEQSYVMVFVEALFLAFALALRVRWHRQEAIRSEVRLGESLRAQLEANARAGRLLEERQWAMQDLAEKGRLLLAAGHDTRQALSALRQYAAGMRGGIPERQVSEVASQIDQIADYLNEVLTTAVEGSRSGGMADASFAVDTLSVTELFSPLLMIYGQEASKKNLQLRLHQSDLMISSDRVLIVRILGNLLSNAIKYTQQGGILVACRRLRGQLRFQVWDTGSGIAADDLKKLLSSETGALRLGNEQADGTGSGFGINHSLAARLGGRIEGRSVPGRGSCFELVLPAPTMVADLFSDLLLLEDDAVQRRTYSAAIRQHQPDAYVQAQMDIMPWINRISADKSMLLIIDQHYQTGDALEGIVREGKQQRPDLIVIITTYDRSIDVRSRLAELADLILYKPVSEQALAAAFHWLGTAGRRHRA